MYPVGLDMLFFSSEHSSTPILYVCKGPMLCMYAQLLGSLTWPRGYKTSFMFNSTDMKLQLLIEDKW